MREIKFRAWDKEKKIMYPPLSAHTAEHMSINFEGEIIMRDDFYPKKFELMQYTGLKDKNGKKIYEDDLLEFNNSGKYFKVFWNERGGCWSVGQTVLGRASASAKVIGNAYETPELLSSSESEVLPKA